MPCVVPGCVVRSVAKRPYFAENHKTTYGPLEQSNGHDVCMRAVQYYCVLQRLQSQGQAAAGRPTEAKNCAKIISCQEFVATFSAHL